MVPPPLIRLVSSKPSSVAASRSTSLPTTWLEPSTRARSCHCQKRSVGPRRPVLRRWSRTSSSAIWTCAGSGCGRITSHRSSARAESLRTGAGLLEHLGGVAVGAHVVPGLMDEAVLADQEGGPDHPGRGLPVQELLTVRTVAPGHLVARVAQQLELEPELAAEAPVALRVVGGDADHVDPQSLEGGQLVVELAGFLRAPGGVVLRIEVDDDLAA